jgi:hypothetical protein
LVGLVIARAAALAVAAASLAACASSGAPPADPPNVQLGSRPLVEPTAAKVLFPVQVAPDIATNTLLDVTLPLWIWTADDPGNLWPMVWIFSPIFGPVEGVLDAWHGYPFWDPVALDEHRHY